MTNTHKRLCSPKPSLTAAKADPATFWSFTQVNISITMRLTQKQATLSMAEDIFCQDISEEELSNMCATLEKIERNLNKAIKKQDETA